MKVAVVLGTRPEFIKLSSFLRSAPKKMNVVAIHTGQHYDLNMSEQVIKELKLPNMKYQIQLPKSSFENQMAKMARELGKIYREERPDAVVVQGDTNSAMMGAVIGKRLGIKVIHVEAGCRSFDPESPEEQNRKIIDSISDIYFCADEKSIKHLKKENITKNVYYSGSTVFDSAEWAASTTKVALLKKLKLNPEQYVVATLHRAENMSDITEFCKKIGLLNYVSNKLPVVFPVHPRTRKFLKNNKIHLGPSIILIEPQTYLPFINLLKNCRFVLSDSGGIQEEAAFFDRPCLILREATEWTRLVDINKNYLVKKIDKKTYKLINNLVEDNRFYEQNREIKAPEISAGATDKIIKVLVNGR